MNNKTNSFIRIRGLRLIAYHAKWDNENKINSIIEQWLSHIEDEKPITARQCIQDALGHFDQIYDDSMQKLVYKDRQKAIKIIRQYTW